MSVFDRFLERFLESAPSEEDGLAGMADEAPVDGEPVIDPLVQPQEPSDSGMDGHYAEIWGNGPLVTGSAPSPVGESVVGFARDLETGTFSPGTFSEVDGDDIQPLSFETATRETLPDNGPAFRPVHRNHESRDPSPDTFRSVDAQATNPIQQNPVDPDQDPDPIPDPDPVDDPVVLTGSVLTDHLEGGSGDDHLDGGFGHDTLSGFDGDDDLIGGYGRDVLIGDGGDDSLDGGYDSDRLFGGNGDDFISGGAGGDSLTGGAGADRLEGGSGDDVYFIGPEALTDVDVIFDASGVDSLRFDGVDPFEAVSLVIQEGNDLNLLYDAGGILRLLDFYDGQPIERLEANGEIFATKADASGGVSFHDFVTGSPDLILEGGSGTDTLSGGDGADFISGMDGADTLSGGAGDDILYGGSDSLSVYDRNDVIHGDAGDDKLYGGWNHDQLYGDEGADSLYGGFGNDTLSGGDGDDRLLGEFGRDTMDGGAGNDVLNGGLDADRMDGGTGNDTLTGSLGNDTFLFRRGGGADRVTDFTALSAGAAYADKMDLGDYGFAGFGALSIDEDSDDNAVIDLGGGNSVTLTGVRADDLSDGDFLF
ncbi:calcium-binding protein [Magnetospira sp. QH-2]|uniref:calcium-binding protein n=1 Tax=Magnetospira sp. (strain QH-2) TaxID=1288970 RepID=UPI0003E81488|nr:calcium-binding protein [Magnetospira sp. QH-2]CCQ72857.1 protein of unknown function, calcium ion binding [Magnetospira sp. QH-2]